MTKQPKFSLLDAACAQPWLIDAAYLPTILSIANRENDSVEMVEKQLGRKLDNSQTATTRGNVALIPISGPIVRYADMFSEISGATSIDTLAKDFNAALRDNAVHAIVLNVDSPGGQSNGISEMSDMIKAARGVKPVVAYVGNMAGSAAYWLASAANEIVISEMAMLGSIGVVVGVRDPAKASSKDIEIVSSQSPKKRLDVSTETGRSEIQRMVDEMASVFVAHVAANRGVSTDTVLSNFGEGGLRIGRDAQKAKMADRIGSLEDLISQLNNPQARASVRKFVAGAEDVTATGETMSAESILNKIKAVLTGEPAAPEAAAVVPTPEAVAIAAENESLKAQLQDLAAKGAKAAAELAEATAKAEEAETARISAEVTTFMATHGGRMGADYRPVFEATLTKAKRGESVTAEDLEAMAKALPLPGSTERIKAGGAAVDLEVAKAAGDVPTDADAERDEVITARAKKEGISYQAAYAIVAREAREAINGIA